MKYSILFFLFLAINLNAQNEDVHKKDSLKAKSVELYREVFWSNLPMPLHWTNDYENLYTDIEKTRLDSIITKFERETSMEIGIVTIDTIKTSKEKFDDLSLHIAQKWGVGKKGKDNGILIAISKGYRRIRIQTGNGTEKIISDEETENIIYEYFIPAFRKDEYYKGTLNGVLEIMRLLKSKTGK
jgi:uncharacterized protein